MTTGTTGDLTGLLGPDNRAIDSFERTSLEEQPPRWIAWLDQWYPTDQGVEVLSVGRDVTDRHLAEEELRASRERFRIAAQREHEERLAQTAAEHAARCAPMSPPGYDARSRRLHDRRGVRVDAPEGEVTVRCLSRDPDTIG